jgi:hypothetical protein
MARVRAWAARRARAESRASVPPYLLRSYGNPAASLHPRDAAGSRLVALFVFFAEGELADCHPWLMSRWIVSFVAPKPGDAQATLQDGELALVPGRAR